MDEGWDDGKNEGSTGDGGRFEMRERSGGERGLGIDIDIGDKEGDPISIACVSSSTS